MPLVKFRTIRWFPAGPDGPRTSWLTDPDGYRIELVQWPPGHRDGISAADFAQSDAQPR